MSEFASEKPVVNRKTLFNSVFWKSVEKYSSQGISFLVSIVMARLLTPAEYGIIGIIGVFIGISDIFINSGISYALISKKECTEKDYCTANWINITISCICYLILFASAPLISSFYEMPILTPTIRVMTLCFIIGAVSGVSRTKLSKEMKFKKLSIATLATGLFSGAIGIIMAYVGYGVWALVFQTVLTSLFSSIWIIAISGFYPRLIFSKESFKALYSFGGKILGSDIIWAIYRNIYPLIIGKSLNAQSVGYFTRATAYSSLVPNNFSGILESVLFPAFASLQDDNDRLMRLYEKALTVTSFLIFSGNFFLMGLAHPLINVMISAKWEPCVPILQILCLSTLFSHILSINGRMFIVKGYPGIFLKISAVFQPISLLIIIISIFFGLDGMAWGAVVSSVLGLIYNCHVFRRVLGVNPLIYLRESFKILVLSGMIGTAALLAFELYLAPNFINLIWVGAVMALIYIGCVKVFMPNIIAEIKSLLKKH